jgi:hypothetical protein
MCKTHLWIRDCVVVFIFTVLSSQLCLFGQNAGLSGKVRDQSGALIPGATITVVSNQQNFRRSTTTNEIGDYWISGLLPGEYALTVDAKGFPQAIVPVVQLDPHQGARVDITMKLASVKQIVTVDGATIQMEAEGGAVGGTIPRTFVDSLPMNGRTLQTLISLVPGVIASNTNNAEQGQFSVNGQRPDANYFMIDGVSANVGVSPNASPGQAAGGALPGLGATGGTNNLVSVDALAEFKVLTSTYEPEFGRTPGGQISMVTRSGSNQFHAIAFEYFRNDVLDANDWFANHNNLGQAALRHNDFGGVIGGPIIRDRTFFFASYEGMRLRLPQSATTDVPSKAARTIAPSAIQPYLNEFPIPNGPVAASNFATYSATYSNPSTIDAFSIRIDHNLNGKLSVFGRYNYSPSEIVQRGIFASTLNTKVGTYFTLHTVTAGSTWAVTSHQTNEARFNWSLNDGKGAYTNDTMGGAVLVPDSALFPADVDTSKALAFFNLSGGNHSRIVRGKLTDNTQHQINILDNHSISYNQHQFKFGFDYRRLAPDFGVRSYLLNAMFKGVNGALTGNVSTATVGTDIGTLTPVFANYSSFAQDTWRLADRFTLTYGVRWEINPAPHEENGHDAAVLLNVNDPANMALAPAGTSLYRTSYGNVAPRVGAAYQLGKIAGMDTILRVGAGLFYDTGSVVAAQSFSGGYPFFKSKVYKGVAFPLTSSQAEPPDLTFTPPYNNVYAFDRDISMPRTFEVSAAVEQNLGRGQTFSATYVGEFGRHLLRNKTLVNPNANFGTVYVTLSNSSSNYHALQLQYQRRLAGRWQTMASYTFSHSIDDTSGDGYFTAPVSPAIDRGSSDFDIRHQFSAAVVANLPYLREQKYLVNKVLGDWVTDWVIIARSASDFTVLTGGDPLSIGQTDYARPDLVPGVNIWESCSSCAGGRQLNPNAFSVPTNRQGTMGRNSLRGLAAYQFNAALHKQFQLKNRLGLQVRGEAFNVFNHANFSTPDNIMSDTTFGKSIQMLASQLSGGTNNASGLNTLYQIGSARSLQIALKLIF